MIIVVGRSIGSVFGLSSETVQERWGSRGIGVGWGSWTGVLIKNLHKQRDIGWDWRDHVRGWKDRPDITIVSRQTKLNYLCVYNGWTTFPF